ncbi:hypothetical protein GIB67_003733 [Kingdonia uniflora]|uniref:Aminotransferase-like plant mobile domain-containing protein n=1 Tax=Kingdonia uniflora TaxID=39325 RepID=A0A7J7MSJ2_9MAGN|nr:hypothetical protein GIB67_003733 [Kingdonia uniflora]
MSLEEEEYDGTSDEDGSETSEEYTKCNASQIHFLSGKKHKIEFEEVVNVSTEPAPPFPQYYGARDFRQLTQPVGKGHLSTSVATTSAQVGFKCQSILAMLRKIYLTLIKVPHLKQRLKATNLMSVFDCKIRNEDNQVVLAMVKHWWPTTHTIHLPCRELGITPKDFTVLTGIGIGTGDLMIFEDFYTEHGNALTIFPNMESKDYEKGCASFAHLESYLDHTRVNINDKAYAKTIFRVFMLLYFRGVLFGNSKSWARLELIGPIAIIENKTYTIDFDSAILRHLYYCLDQTSKQEVKYIDGLFQLIEYHCYEYCQIGHHILIDNRLDNFWPKMLAWQTKRRKFTGNKAKHHLALMRQQLDLHTINNMQWEPFRNIKDALKREWYLGDRCWAQLEHLAVSYDPPGNLHCLPTSDVVSSLRVTGWIEAQHYIVGHHVDYNAYLRYVSHGALMSDIVTCENIDIPGLGTLTGGVTFLHAEFPTVNFSTQEAQIPPPQFGDYPGWIMELGSPYGTTWHTIPSIATISTIDVPTGYDFFAMIEGMRKLTLDRTLDLEARRLHDESCITQLAENLRRADDRLSQLNEYLNREGIEVGWEDEGGTSQAGTSQAGTSRGRSSRGRGSRGRTSEGGAAPPRRSKHTQGSFV